MSRYHALAEYLKRLDEPVWEAGFEEIEKLLGAELPKSAYRYPAWWANQSGAGHSQTSGWKSVGWKTAKLDLASRRVRFERESADLRSAQPPAIDDQLFEEARKLTGIDDRVALVREGLRALIARKAAERLARLGGSMPDFAPAPRERSV